MFDLSSAATDTWSPREPLSVETFTPVPTFSLPTTICAHPVGERSRLWTSPKLWNPLGFHFHHITNMFGAQPKVTFTVCAVIIYLSEPYFAKLRLNVILKMKRNVQNNIKSVLIGSIQSLFILLHLFFCFSEKKIATIIQTADKFLPLMQLEKMFLRSWSHKAWLSAAGQLMNTYE